MGNLESSQLHIRDHSNSIPKTAYGGLIPCCIGEEDQKVYILLAEQPIYPLSNSGVGGWNPLGGLSDPTDLDMQHSAAREAYEEALGAVGSINFIREILLENRNSFFFCDSCFLMGYGQLNDKERNWIVNYHKEKSKKLILTKTSWEVSQLKWFEVNEIRNLVLNFNANAHSISNTNDNTDANTNVKTSANVKDYNFISGNRIRPWFWKLLLKLDWSEESELGKLANGEYPFDVNEDHWYKWRERKWISIDGKTVK